MSNGPLLSINPCEDSDERPSAESFLRRMRLILWAPHQRYVGLILLVCLIVMAVYFVQRNFANQGLIEIDQVEPLQADFKIDINRAGWAEIVVLPGVGEKLAKSIVERRQSIGAFDSPEALLEVTGIGQKKLEQLRPYLLPITTPQP